MALSRGGARLGLALLLLAGVPAPGQTPDARRGPPTAPTRPPVRTELVQLDVTVSDKSGRNVPGLTARDFVLLEDGRPQALSHFAIGGRAGLEEAGVPVSPAAPAAAAPAAPP